VPSWYARSSFTVDVCTKAAIYDYVLLVISMGGFIFHIDLLLFEMAHTSLMYCKSLPAGILHRLRSLSYKIVVLLFLFCYTHHVMERNVCGIVVAETSYYVGYCQIGRILHNLRGVSNYDASNMLGKATRPGGSSALILALRSVI
jgi:hypothetical protein